MAETPEKSEDRNGLDSPKKTEERTQDYKSLIDYGLDTKVAGRLDDIYKTGINVIFDWIWVCFPTNFENLDNLSR